MHVRPLTIIIALSVVAGILISQAISANYFLAFIPLLLSPLIYSAILFLSRTPFKALSIAKWHYIWIVILMGGIGAMSESIQRPEILKRNYPENSIVKARIESVVNDAEYDRLIVSVLNIKSPFREDADIYHNLKAIIRSDGLLCNPGDIIAFKSSLDEIKDNPNFKSTGYALRMRNQGIYYTGFLENEDIKILEQHRGIGYYISAMRYKAESVIERSGLSTDAKKFESALLLGDRNALDSDTKERFATAGISHVLALSGMHIGIIASMIMFLFWPLNLSGHHKLRYLFAIPALWIYVMVTGGAPATLRAAIMLTFILIAIVLERKKEIFDFLTWAVVIIVLSNPLAVNDVGLWLSVTCVGSLILFVEKLNVIDYRANPVTHKFFGAVTGTLVATFASWPIIAHVFSKLPVMFLPSNLIVVPLLPLYVYMSVIYLVLSSMGLEVHFLSAVLSGAFDILNKTVSATIGDSGNVIDIYVGKETVFLWIAAICMAAYILHKRPKHVMPRIMTVLTFVVAFVSIPLSARAYEKRDNGFIVQHTYPDISVINYCNGSEKCVKPYRKSSSFIRICGKEILILDSTPLSSCRLPENSDIIVIGSGYKRDIRFLKDSLLRSSNAIPLIITHSSIRRNREEYLKAQADSLNLKVHSLRYDGPYSHWMEN